MNAPLISILISTFNWPCHKLAGQLEALVQKENEDSIEIIVGDDASTDEQVLRENQTISSLPHCRYITFSKNNGRARIRNRLAGLARGRYLLFIDSDAEVISRDFLRNYLNCLPQNKVVYGGISTPPASEYADRTLRIAYETAASRIRTLDYRRKHPYSYISAFNILIEHALFNRIMFDERCTTYGYEDALLGIELKLRQEPIFHIDNPLLHTGIDTNSSFLEKVEQSLQTLQQIGLPMQKVSAIHRLYHILHHIGLDTVAAFTFTHGLKRAYRANLLSATPSLLVLRLYKIGYYCHLHKQSGKSITSSYG